MKFNRRQFLATSAVTAAALGFSGNAFAADTEIKISHQWKQDTDARDRAARVFTKAVEAKDSSIKFRIYPGSSLNIKPVAQLDAMQSGTLEMAIYPLTYAVGKIPEFSITLMPGTIPSLPAALALKGTDFHKKLQSVAEKNGIRIVTWWWTPGGFATKTREITGPDSVKGLKMRAADPTFEIMLKEAGASVVGMPSTEIYPALQSGVIDGALTSAESFVSFRLYEQTKFATVGGEYTLWMLCQPLVMSKAAWDKLSPEQQKTFEEAADESDAYFTAEQAKAASNMADKFTAAGAKVRQLTGAEYNAWVSLAKKTSWPTYAETNADCKELLSLIQKAGA